MGPGVFLLPAEASTATEPTSTAAQTMAVIRFCIGMPSSAEANRSAKVWPLPIRADRVEGGRCGLIFLSASDSSNRVIARARSAGSIHGCRDSTQAVTAARPAVSTTSVPSCGICRSGSRVAILYTTLLSSALPAAIRQGGKPAVAV